MEKKHQHRYRAELDKYIIGLRHAWFYGHCAKKNCTARIDQVYINADQLERTGVSVFSYWYSPIDIPKPE